MICIWGFTPTGDGFVPHTSLFVFSFFFFFYSFFAHKV